MKIGDRMAERMKALSLSQAELARRIGVSQPTISAVFNGETRQTRHLRAIAAELETSEGWLLGEVDDVSAGTVAALDRDAMADRLGLVLVPEMEMSFAMGSGSFLEVFEQRGVRAFDREWLRSVSEGNLAKLFVADGDGDSMEPTLRDGDTVLIDAAQKVVNRGDRIWAVSYGGLGLIKRVRPLPDNTYELMSDNLAVRSIIASADELKVVGRVIWIGRRF